MIFYTIELIGGPDDGATFKVHQLDLYWEMKLDSWDLDEVQEKSSMYWKSEETTDKGHIRYYSTDAVELYWIRRTREKSE